MNYYSHHLITQVPSLVLHQLKGMESLITCYPNPSVKILPVLKEVYGVNYYITSIFHLDQLYYIKTKTKQWGIEFDNFLFTDDDLVIHKAKDYNINNIANEIARLYEKLKANKITLLIQCSGGSFKVGIITYCLLRMSGEPRDEALKLLTKLRGETRNGFGDLRIEYAEKNIVPLLIPKELL